MTQKLLFLIFPLLLLIFVSSADAQTATTRSAQAVQKRTNVLQKRDELKAIIQTKKDEFKTRIQTIKDQKKKALVERIDAKISRINEKQSSKFSETLSILQRFLDKIKSSTANTKVVADITAAQIALDAAKTTVEAQANKVYTMEITDDAALRLNAGKVVSQFRQDLSAAHKLITDAKQAIQKLNTDRKIIKKDATRRLPDGKPSTSSANL